MDLGITADPSRITATTWGLAKPPTLAFLMGASDVVNDGTATPSLPKRSIVESRGTTGPVTKRAIRPFERADTVAHHPGKRPNYATASVLHRNGCTVSSALQGW